MVDGFQSYSINRLLLIGQPLKMFFKKILPHKNLQNHIAYCWILEDTESCFSCQQEHFLPDGHFELIIDLEEKVMQCELGRPWEIRPHAFLAGAFQKSIFVKPLGKIKSIGVVFKPGCIASFVHQFSARELNSKIIHLEEIFPNDGNELLEKIEKCKTDEEKISQLQSFLSKKFMLKNQNNDLVKNVTLRICDSGGAVSIDELSKQFKISNRHLRRKFNDYLGLSPKSFSKIIRIHQLVKFYKLHPAIKLTELAYHAGYFDQAHFIKEFKEVAGTTPSNYFAKNYTLNTPFLIQS